MSANQIIDWGNEPTVILPRFRTIFVGCEYSGHLIHVTPKDYHVVDMDCDGVCLVCGNPLEKI